jgi:hypothetical protein
MWIDAKGAVHTVALPDPAAVLTPRARASLDRLRAAVGTDLVESALIAEDDAFLEGAHEPDGDGEFAFEPPPLAILDGDLDSVEALADAVRLVPERWRLDVIEALLDLVDEG